MIWWDFKWELLSLNLPTNPNFNLPHSPQNSSDTLPGVIDDL